MRALGLLREKLIRQALLLRLLVLVDEGFGGDVGLTIFVVGGREAWGAD
jgi:hypothetical protein